MNQRREPVPLWACPFRPFFLSSALAAALLVPLWLWIWLNGQQTLALPPVLWHQHEMLAGLLNAAIAGFLLTAVCNWTGTTPLSGWRLLGLWLIWLGGRLAMGLAGEASPLAVALDLAFMPLVALDAGLRIWRARQRRQLVVLLVVMAFWLLDIAFHVSGQAHYLHALVMLGALLILVIGGRITPAFTANWLRQQGAAPARFTLPTWMDRAGLLSVAAMVGMEAVGSGPAWLMAVLAAMATLLVIARPVYWSAWRTRSEPLLWILHLGHVWVALGLALRGVAAMSVVPDTAWLHALGAGAIGTMILGVVTRVTVGHTGRPMLLQRGALPAYGLMLIAGLTRVAVALGWVPMMPGLWTAAFTWSAAWVLFVVSYGPILLAPRADGRPG